jgi:hypothetical protein
MPVISVVRVVDKKIIIGNMEGRGGGGGGGGEVQGVADPPPPKKKEHFSPNVSAFLFSRITGAKGDKNIHATVSEQLKKNFAKSRWKVKVATFQIFAPKKPNWNNSFDDQDRLISF